jgi:hypothetical protein
MRFAKIVFTRISAAAAMAAVPDLLLNVLFIAAFVKTPKAVI